MNPSSRILQIFGLACVLVAIASSANTPAAHAQDKAKKKFEIKGKCFNSDRPEEQINPRLIIATLRPGPGQAPIPAKDYKPRIDNNFFVVEFEYNDFIENLTFEFPGDFNAVVLKKLICKENMTVYFAASDADKGVFNFPGYTAQFGTYRDIFNEVTKLGRSPEQMRGLFKDRLLKMPAADDPVRLPDLTPQERQEARKIRNDVLRLYGLLPAVTQLEPGQQPPIYGYPCLEPSVCYYPAQRCGLFSRLRGR